MKSISTSRRSRRQDTLSKSFSLSAWLKPSADFADRLKTQIALLPVLVGKAQEISAIAQAAFEIHVAQRAVAARQSRSQINRQTF